MFKAVVQFSMTLLLGSISVLTLAQQPVRLLGADCTPALDQPVTEPVTGRTFVLDYPCDLRAGEEVTFILNLHGGGSGTRYQHGYFPAFEYKEEFRLVIATPYSPVRRWSEVDDEYLQLFLARSACRPDGLYRAVAVRLPLGKWIGGFKFEGIRGDDPNDIFPHENRRELRGLRLFAAWLNHYNCRAINTWDYYIPQEGLGFIRH